MRYGLVSEQQRSELVWSVSWANHLLPVEGGAFRIRSFGQCDSPWSQNRWHQGTGCEDTGRPVPFKEDPAVRQWEASGLPWTKLSMALLLLCIELNIGPQACISLPGSQVMNQERGSCLSKNAARRDWLEGWLLRPPGSSSGASSQVGLRARGEVREGDTWAGWGRVLVGRRLTVFRWRCNGLEREEGPSFQVPGAGVGDQLDGCSPLPHLHSSRGSFISPSIPSCPALSVFQPSLYVYVCVCVCVCVCVYACAQSCATLWPHGLQPTRLPSLWDFPG